MFSCLIWCCFYFKMFLSYTFNELVNVQVFFSGEKIGVGMGKTRRDAQQQAAENALHSLAGKIRHMLLFSISSNKESTRAYPN